MEHYTNQKMQQYTILPSCLDYEHFVSQILGTPWHSLRIPTQANPPLDKVLILYKLVWALGFPHSYWLRIRLQCGRPGFDSWAGKIPWRRERLPTPVVWPGEFHGLYSLWSLKESDKTKPLLLSLRYIYDNNSQQQQQNMHRKHVRQYNEDHICLFAF